MNMFLRSKLTLYKCIVSAFIQRSWRIRNWTIENHSRVGCNADHLLKVSSQSASVSFKLEQKDRKYRILFSGVRLEYYLALH